MTPQFLRNKDRSGRAMAILGRATQSVKVNALGLEPQLATVALRQKLLFTHAKGPEGQF
jgi:hypothetical protein